MEPRCGTNRTATQVAMKVFVGEGSEGPSVFRATGYCFTGCSFAEVVQVKIDSGEGC